MIFRDNKGTSYNKIAGQSVRRLGSLSDCVFSVAMTLLVLDLHVPVNAITHSEGDIWRVLVALVPKIGMFAMSFLTLGIYWTGQQTQLNHFRRGDRNLTWIHITFLFAVSIMPFSTKFLAEFITYRTAFVVYWVNLFALSTLLYVSWTYATKHGLLKANVPEGLDAAIKKRVMFALVLLAFGVLLSVINTYWSLGFILLIQLNYAIAPRFSHWLG